MKSGMFILFENFDSILILMILCIIFFLVFDENLRIMSKVKEDNRLGINLNSYISEIDLKGSRVQAIVFLIIVGILILS